MISKLEIKNYRRIGDVPLRLESLANVNYLVGANGAGKSSILQIVYILGRLKEYSAGSEMNEEGIVSIHDSAIHNSGVGYLSSDIHDKFAVSFTDNAYGMDNNFVLYTDYETEPTAGIYPLLLKLKDTEKNSDLLIDDRISAYILDPMLPEIILHADEEGNHVTETLDEISNQLIDHGIIPSSLFSHIIKTGNHSLNSSGSLGSEDFFFIETIFKQVGLDIGILSNDGKIRDGLSLIAFDSLASGKKWIYQLVLGILLFTKGMKRLGRCGPASNSFICIENPENSLEPKYQKYMPYILERLGLAYNIQFFVSTHSPFLVSSASKFETHKVYLIKDGQTVDRAMNLGKGTIGYKGSNCLTVASEMLGAYVEDMQQSVKIEEELNIVFCEGGGKKFKDSDVFQTLFPRDKEGRKNLFISCGGANEARVAFHNAESLVNAILGEKVRLFLLIDRSCSKGIQIGPDEYIGKDGWITMEQRSKFLSLHKSFRMLSRREIENYIYTPEVMNSMGVKLIATEDTDWNALNIKDEKSKYFTEIPAQDLIVKHMSELGSLPIKEELYKDIFTTQSPPSPPV